MNKTKHTTMPSDPSSDHHISKRAVVSASLVIVALISVFSAGSAVGFAVQGQLAEQKAEAVRGEIEELEASVETLRGKIQPATFLNSVGGLAAHDMATAMIFANSVARTANYYTGGTGASSGTK